MIIVTPLLFGILICASSNDIPMQSSKNNVGNSTERSPNTTSPGVHNKERRIYNPPGTHVSTSDPIYDYRTNVYNSTTIPKDPTHQDQSDKCLRIDAKYKSLYFGIVAALYLALIMGTAVSFVYYFWIGISLSIVFILFIPISIIVYRKGFKDSQTNNI